MKFDVIIIGGATQDLMFYTEEMQVIKNPKKYGSKMLFAFEAGDKIASDREIINAAGGGGGNVSVSLAKLGLKVALAGAVGNDAAGVSLKENFTKAKINLDYLQTIKDSWSGLSFVITGPHKNEHIIFTHRAANEKFKLTTNEALKFKSNWLYLTSLSGKNWQINLNLIFNSAFKNKIKVAWNPGCAQLTAGYKNLKKYLKQTEILILNREEAIDLCMSAGYKVTTINKAAACLKNLGPKIVSVSDGSKGASIFAGDKLYYQKTLTKKGVNTTGAGDAFGSSLVGGLIIFKNNLQKALRLAMIRSDRVVQKPGAQEGLLTLNEVNKNYKL